jgi:hypothetical protein
MNGRWSARPSHSIGMLSTAAAYDSSRLIDIRQGCGRSFGVE